MLLSLQDVAGSGAGADVDDGNNEDLDDDEAMEGS